MGTYIADPDYLYYKNIETGVEVTVEHTSYEETDTNYYEETYSCDELGEEWYSISRLETWMTEHGYTSEY